MGIIECLEEEKTRKRVDLKKSWAGEFGKRRIRFEYASRRIRVFDGTEKRFYVPDFYFSELDMYAYVNFFNRCESKKVPSLRELAQSGAKVLDLMHGGKFSFVSENGCESFLYTCESCGKGFFAQDFQKRCPYCDARITDRFKKENGKIGLQTWKEFGIKTLIDKEALMKSSTAYEDEISSVAEMLSGTPHFEMFTEEKIRRLKELFKEHPNLKEVEEYFENIISLLNFKEDARITFPPILLLGNPGCGKTEWATRASEILCGRLIRMDCGNELTTFQLTGSQRGYLHAEPGLVLKSMYSSGNGPLMNPVIIFDELEKIKSDRHSPEYALLSLLEKSSSKTFMDNFLEQAVDASNINYIACCNSLEGIPAPVLSRFRVFKVSDYSNEHLVEHVIPRIYEGWVKDEKILQGRVPETLSRECRESIAALAEGKVRNIKHAILEMFNRTQKKFYGFDVAFFSDSELERYANQ